MSHSLSPKCISFPPPGNRLSEANVCYGNTVHCCNEIFTLHPSCAGRNVVVNFDSVIKNVIFVSVCRD